MLLYLIVKGDSIGKGHYESDMTAKIIFFAQFENMLGSPDSFQDINIMLGNIGKMRYEEMYVIRGHTSTSINVCFQEQGRHS